jgi:hypothetical protein
LIEGRVIVVQHGDIVFNSEETRRDTKAHSLLVSNNWGVPLKGVLSSIDVLRCLYLLSDVLRHTNTRDDHAPRTELRGREAYEAWISVFTGSDGFNDLNLIAHG